MLTTEKTADYVKRWVAAFESKDLDRVLAFYSNDVIFHSPLVARLSHDPSGTVQGKAALRAYVKKGFEVFDHIKFTVLDVLRGVDIKTALAGIYAGEREDHRTADDGCPLLGRVRVFANVSCGRDCT